MTISHTVAKLTEHLDLIIHSFGAVIRGLALSPPVGSLTSAGQGKWGFLKVPCLMLGQQ